MAAFNAFIERLINIPMDQNDYQNELNIIKHIAYVNGYNPTIIDKLHTKKLKKKNNNTKNVTPTENKYTSITYTNILPQTIQYEFKKHNINISFKTNNNIKNILKTKSSTDTKICSGVYKLCCNDCEKFYIGQTGRTFYERFQEHKPKPNTKSTYAQHLIDNNHNYTNFDRNLTPLHIINKKGKALDATEEFEIFKAYQLERDNILNDKLTIKNNILFNTAVIQIHKEGRRQT